MSGPFKNPLEKGDLFKESPSLYETKGMEGKVVRKIDADLFKKTLPEINNPAEKALIIKKLFQELENYGIEAPVKWVVAEAPIEDKYQGPALYALTDKINGTEFGNISLNEEEKAFVKIKDTINSWIDYISSKLDQDGYFLTDITRGRQYVYGKKEGDLENKVYLVDTDPFISKDKDELFFNFIMIPNEIDFLEETFKRRFDESRGKLNTLLEKIQNIPKFKGKDFADIKKILNI